MSQKMPRRTDLYSPTDLEPVAGEFRRLRDVEGYYARVGALIPSTHVAGPELKALTAREPREGEDVDLVEILRVCLDEHGIPFEWKAQNRGTCVGQAASFCSDIVMAVAWLILGRKFPSRAAVATCYAGSKVEVAGRPSRWDGSNGSWVAKWLREWGVATLFELGLAEDELAEDERLGVRWAALRSGVPEKFELLSRDRPIIETPFVTDVNEAITLIQAGCPVIDCSNLIPRSPNSDGVSTLYRGGGHATSFTAVRWRRGGPQIKYSNSWGRRWGVNGEVWLSARDADRILKQRDSYGLVGVQGLESEVKL